MQNELSQQKLFNLGFDKSGNPVGLIFGGRHDYSTRDINEFRRGRIDISKILFEEMPKRDMISWSSMIEAYAENNQSVEALDLFMRLKQQGNTLDYVILLSVIRACANLVSIRRACLIHGVALKSLPELNLVLQTALIDLYVKGGSIHSARRVFDQIKERNLVTWSTMIAGYGMLGHGNEALNLFWQMKKELVQCKSLEFPPLT